MSKSRFIVGIDLGTTNCALAYLDTGAGEKADVQLMPIPQVVKSGIVESRNLLPSFLYLPAESDQPKGSLQLPWDKDRDYCVGEFARNFGSQVPIKLVSSAKSWLCHHGVDRRQPILPSQSPAGVRTISPLEASTLYLKHLCEAWNHQIGKEIPEYHLEHQEIILTVPASFDAVARDLTIEAAQKMGFENLTLLEEPQAAFYAWLDSLGEKWREVVKVGDLILVADVGGGTTDFTLIQVTEEKGTLALSRVAVGDHLLLGGDNMDLALAHMLAQKLSEKGVKLDAGQRLMLSHASRQAKETILNDDKIMNAPITILGRGSKVIGGAIKTELTRAELEKVLLDGFLPLCEANTKPTQSNLVGLQEMGLPFVSDPAISKHLAFFLSRQLAAIQNAEEANTIRLAQNSAERKGNELHQKRFPSAVLFNGGVFKANLLRQRLIEQLNRWRKEDSAQPLQVLQESDFDLAVARGAAYYGHVRRGKGIRIRGGTARSYYIGVVVPTPSVPGMSPPIKPLCVVPFGMEEGTSNDLQKQEFFLSIGEPVEFRFLGSTVRHEDAIGTMIEDWEETIEELSIVSATLSADNNQGQKVPVHLHSKLNEVGQLELWFISRDGHQRWKLEYNVREKGV